MKCTRRSSLRALGTLTAALAGAMVLGSAPDEAAARRPAHLASSHSFRDVSVTLENEFGSALESHFHNGSMYVVGDIGTRYKIRVTNHTAGRVEAVVTVDGRDVVTGALGNYKKQRGYVIAPFDSVTIDGFRQSLDHVAAFRFTDVGNSYSSRRGTPQHVGVVGVAVFKEKGRRRQQPKPIARRPYYEPQAGVDARSSSKSRRAPSAAEAAPSASFDDAGPSGGSFAPAPRTNNIGTEYGETHASSVREVEFKRRRARRPDAVLTAYYDTRDGLRARGIPVDPPHFYYPYAPEPEPFPRTNRRFAPPPPR